MARLFTLLVSLSTACATGGALPPDPQQIEEMEVKAEKLNAGDVVEIKVFREPDLAGIYRVGRDGTIDFPLIGKVAMRDKHPDVVAGEIRGRLADGFLRSPQVTVFVREQKSQKIHVLGEVSKAGSFPYEPGMTVIQATTTAAETPRTGTRMPGSVLTHDIRAALRFVARGSAVLRGLSGARFEIASDQFAELGGRGEIEVLGRDEVFESAA